MHKSLGVLFASAAVALGGHALWESNIEHNLEAYNLTSTLRKRAFTVKEGSQFQLWVNDRDEPFLPICYDTGAEVMRGFIHDAMELWYERGLPRYFQYDDSDNVDCNPNYPDEYLLVRHNDEGILQTTNGKAFGNGARNVMQISDNPITGNLDTVSNVAHELGHAWGLIHEHQRITHRDEFVFDCTALEDYATYRPRLEAKYPTESPAEIDERLNDVCTSWMAAATEKFSSSQFLPIELPEHTSEVGDDVDWDSIMLYTTGVGGRQLNPGDPNSRAAVLRRRMPNGQVVDMPPNMEPSARDAAALEALYPVPEDSDDDDSDDEDSLPLDPNSSTHNTFRDITGTECGEE